MTFSKWSTGSPCGKDSASSRTGLKLKSKTLASQNPSTLSSPVPPVGQCCAARGQGQNDRHKHVANRMRL